jgi:hypothetical protein
MNLVLSFVHFGKPPRQAGPFSSIVLDGDSVRPAEGGEPIALHREHQWEVEGERYFRLDASTPVRIHFERDPRKPEEEARSRSFGPFERFSAVDGITYVDDRVFAFTEPTEPGWSCYDDGRRWLLMVVTDAGASRPPAP